MGKNILGVMIDMSRNAVMKIEELKKFLKLLSDFGYNTVQLYTEDTYEVEGEPYFGYMRGKYTRSELKEIDRYCISLGIELVPCIQTLAHLKTLFRWPKYEPINDIDDILLVGEEKTYEFIEKLFASVAETFSSRKINIGMDEAHLVGLGKYLDKNGYRDRFALLNEHMKKVMDISEKYGFKTMMWSDMFFRVKNGGAYYGKEFDGNVKLPDEIVNGIPKEVSLIYWDYYNRDTKTVGRMLKAHKRFKNNTIFAGGAWCWKGFVPDNKFSLSMMLPAIEECKKQGVSDILVTLWGDDGKECSYYAVLPSLFRIAKTCISNTNKIPDEMAMEQEFYDLTGANYRDMMTLDDADYVNGACEHETPSKYMLYNDVFLGIYDSTVQGNEGEYYKKLCEHFSTAVKRNGKYDYLFKLQEKLCAVLADKFCLGVRIRAAYQRGDKKELLKCLDTLRILPEKVKDFYLALKTVWEKENKPFGLEVQQQRLGGLILRLTECGEKLEKYLKGEIEIIEELEEKLLDACGGGKEFVKKPVHASVWSKIVSVSPI